MKIVEYGEIEVIPQTGHADTLQKARERMARIVATPDEVLRGNFARNEARNQNDRPGIPCDDYGLGD